MFNASEIAAIVGVLLVALLIFISGYQQTKSKLSLKTTFTTQEKPIIAELLPIPTEELSQIKAIFGIDTFFATETISYQEGAIFKGNLRGEPESVYDQMSAKLKQISGDKYCLFLVESPEGKPVVIILPSVNSLKPTTLAEKNLALVLIVSTLVTSLEAAGMLLGFDWFSQIGRYREVLPLGLGLLSILIAYEISHRLVARRYQMRLSVPFFLPTWQLGSFGAISRFESLLPNRSVLFDIAVAGPAVAGLVSLIILLVGLFISNPESIIQIPSQFFQGSVLVGTLAHLFLGEALNNSLVTIDPLTILGWLGLVITALNLLPAGQLDGGRIILAIYGRKIARRATLATIIILGGIALINPGNPIPLYWTLLILFLQRKLERPSLNELTELDDLRAAWGLLALFLMLTILVPLNPSLAQSLGIGYDN